MSSADSCGSAQRSRYLPSRFSSALALVLSMRSSPPGVTRRNRFRPGIVEIFPRSSARLVAVSLSDAGDQFLELGDQLGADRGVAVGGVGVVADDEPVGRVGDPDFLDLHVPGDVLVAALPGQRGLDLRGSGAELLPDDVAAGALLQEPAVLSRRRTRGRRPR